MNTAAVRALVVAPFGVMNIATLERQHKCLHLFVGAHKHFAHKARAQSMHHHLPPQSFPHANSASVHGFANIINIIKFACRRSCVDGLRVPCVRVGGCVLCYCSHSTNCHHCCALRVKSMGCCLLRTHSACVCAVRLQPIIYIARRAAGARLIWGESRE